MLRPIEGPAWGYRYRARLSVRYVAKKGTVLVGFHERKSRYVADMQRLPGAAARTSARC
jgi:23S rRNA (uracil1939-C5)-methyltransferase